MIIINYQINLMKKSIKKNIENSHQAFQMWKDVPWKKRQKLIKKLADILEKNAEKFGKIITEEMNKPISQATAEVKKCSLMLNYYADMKPQLQVEKVKTDFAISEIHYVPKGIILGVMPWNFPFWQVLRFAVPAILAGNTVILKHASICIESGNTIQKIFEKAGFPKGVFTHLEIGHDEVAEVLAHEYVQGVSFTGSEKAGGEIASIAGKNIKKSLLELGGSDAFIVLEDANLEKTVAIAVNARMQNAGQSCIASKRFLIHESVADAFVSQLKKAIQKLKTGNPLDKSIEIGSLARTDLAEELDVSQQYISQLESGRRKPTLVVARKLENIYETRMEILFPDIFLSFETTKCNKNKIETA